MAATREQPIAGRMHFSAQRTEKGDVQCFGMDCYALAFGVPAALMFVALSSSQYEVRPPGRVAAHCGFQWAEFILFGALLVAVAIIFSIMGYFYVPVDPDDLKEGNNEDDDIEKPTPDFDETGIDNMEEKTTKI